MIKAELRYKKIQSIRLRAGLMALAFLAWLLPLASVNADNPSSSISISAVNSPSLTVSALSAAEKAQLQAQLQDLQSQISQLQGQLGSIESQKNTLQSKIKQLQNQQQTLALQVQATNLQIEQIDDQINQSQAQIAADQAQVQMQQGQIAQMLDLINSQDQTPILYALASGKDLADVFDAIQNYASTTDALGAVVNKTKNIETQLQADIQGFNQQQGSAQNYLGIQGLEQQQLAESTSEQNDLLKQTKGKESDYQIAISGTQAQASQIEAQLYQLAGGGSTSAVTFGQAADIAKGVSAITGIDEAFLLAILTQESDLGQNVGTCNRPGDPPSKSWQVIMKPDRDQQPFLQITSSLGLDPDTTPVSCPMHDKNGNQVGWGGAMGPAQFIPSTWVAYAPKVSAITGSPANPWDIKDAFIAAAIKLVAGGADGTYQGDWDAAMRYFSGGTNSAYSFYGDDVMATTAKYQADLTTINQ
jgi:membrane-bound lytic murein transglycosylase B